MGGMPRIPVAEIVLYQPQIMPPVGKGEAAGMAEHMRVNMADPGPFCRCTGNVIHRLAGEGLFSLGNKQPGQRIIAPCQPAFDGAELVAGDWLLDTESILEAADPEPRLREINILPPERNGLGNPKPVPEHHQDQQMIASAMSARLGGGKKAIDLGKP